MDFEIKKGHQCFIVYPLIEESEKLDLKAALTAFDSLKDDVFKDFNIGYIDGEFMPAAPSWPPVQLVDDMWMLYKDSVSDCKNADCMNLQKGALAKTFLRDRSRPQWKKVTDP